VSFIDNSGSPLLYLLRRLLAALRSQVRGSRHRRQLLDQLRAAQLIALGRCSDGPVQVEGRVQGIALLRAPISRRMVVGYRLILEQVERNDIEWLPMCDVRRFNTFRLVDDEGEGALVRPDDAVLFLRPRCYPVDDLLTLLRSPELGLLLQQNGISSTLLVAARLLRITEYAIAPGDTIFVHGVARRRLDPLSEPKNYRALPTTLHIAGAPESPLLLADRPRRELLARLDRGLGRAA
jgi:hypothetical protein